MENVKLRKMTAFAAALALAAQSGMAVISAEETENISAEQTVSEEGNDTVTVEVPADNEEQSVTKDDSEKDDPMVKFILKSYYVDRNDDGILSDEELSTLKRVELNGNYFSKPLTSLGILNKAHVSYLTLTNMSEFDLELLKGLKYLKTLEFMGNTSVKNIEALGELDLDLITVDTPDSEGCIKAEDVYPYIKCKDITIEKGEIKQLLTTPNYDSGYAYYSSEKNTVFQFTDRNSVLPLERDVVGSSLVKPVTSAFQDRAFIYGLAEGESEYTLSDAKGNIIGKAKITVTAAEEPNDPALVKAEAKLVKVLKTEVNEYDDYTAYILYDNGILCTFKDGTLKEFQKNIKDAAINKDKIYALSEDGVLYRNGKAVNDKTEYTVKTASKDLNFILCSDDCVRCVSEGKAETILDNVKSLDEGFGTNHVITGIVQDKDDVTSIVYRDLDGKYVMYPLTVKFEPVKITFQNPTLDGGLYYVLTADNKVYKIQAYFPVKNIPGFDNLSETKPSASVSLFTENVKDIYRYLYLTEDGKAYSFGGSEDVYDEEKIILDEMSEYGNIEITCSDLTDLKRNIIGKITKYSESYYSVRDNDGTERYDFIENAKPFTHVKMNYGIYKHGDNKCVLIQREDDTLWKYIIETGELVRIDEAINGSEVLTGTDPEPEKSEPKEPSENENKDGEPEKAAPDKKNESGNTAGDISGDGQVDVTDLTMISLGLLGDLTLNETQRQFADVNHDGKVDLADLATLRQFLSKKISSLA